MSTPGWSLRGIFLKKLAHTLSQLPAFRRYPSYAIHNYCYRYKRVCIVKRVPVLLELKSPARNRNAFFFDCLTVLFEVRFVPMVPVSERLNALQETYLSAFYKSTSSPVSAQPYIFSYCCLRVWEIVSLSSSRLCLSLHVSCACVRVCMLVGWKCSRKYVLLSLCAFPSTQRCVANVPEDICLTNNQSRR